MGYSNKIKKIKFPEKIRFGEEPTNKFFNSSNNIKVTTLQTPPKDIKKICAEMILSTWRDTPEQEPLSDEKIDEIFMDLLTFKVLPNSMEAFNFTFKIEGLTHIETSHILRHRTFKAIHYQCSGDRFLTHDSIFIPSSIDKNSKFRQAYKDVSVMAKRLYQDMVDSKEVSLMDARYILTRNNRYFAYFTMNIKEILAFINQRKCTMIQPELDNLIAFKIYDEVCAVIPEIAKVVHLECGPRCHYIMSKPERNTRLYNPDKIHKQYMKEVDESIYNKTREEMGINYGKD